MINRKLSLLALLAMMLLGVACAPQSTDEPTDGAMEEPTQETVEQPADDDNAACEEGFRPFVDVTGEAVCVPDVAERIVAIHDINAGAQILSLGGPLVGMASRDAGFRDDITRYFDIESIADVGLVYEPNVEAILELEPDLIVHEGFEGQVSFLDESVVTSLREIAPLVAIDTFRPVEEVMADYEELLGDAATISLDEQRAEFDTLLADIEAVLGDEWQNTTVSLVDVAESNGALQIWGPTALVPLDILTRAGASWVPIMVDAGSEENGGYIGGVSLERIDELDADLTLVDVRFTPETVDDPLYQQLPAVEAGQVILLAEPFSGTHYPNYIATAEILLEQLNDLGGIDTELVTEAGEAVAQGGDECEAGFRLFEHYGGTTCIPEDPQRIVTTQDQNGLLPLLELGVRPVGSTGLVLDDGTSRFRRVDEYDTSGIEFVGPYWGQANVESMLALEPDLIVSHEFAEDFYEQHSEIAPTVMIQIFERPLTEVLMDFAELAGRTDQGEAFNAAYEARVQALLDDLGDRADDLTISVITPGDTPGEFYNAALGQAIGTVMDDLDLQRPAPEQSDSDNRDYFSVETLAEHDADVMLIIDFSGDDDDPVVQEFISSPLFTSLGVAQAEQVYIIDGTQTVGAAWGKMDNFLAELEAILLDPDLNVNVVDETE